MANTDLCDPVQDHMVAAKFRRESHLPCGEEMRSMSLTKVHACVDIQPICSSTCLVRLHCRLIHRTNLVDRNCVIEVVLAPSALLCVLKSDLLWFLQRLTTQYWPASSQKWPISTRSTATLLVALKPCG